MEHEAWPALNLDEWEPTYLTLHRWTQIVGKVRMAHAPWLNHWWQVPLYVCPAGLTTSAVPFENQQFSMTLDFHHHQLRVATSQGTVGAFELEPMAVATFYDRTMALLDRLGLSTRIWPVPVEVVDTTPFTEDRHHAAYDRTQVERLHRVLVAVDRVFEVHRGLFLGKSSPVHFFWGAFDLAVTRFSGRRNPSPPEDQVNAEAYSHEVISHGFWPGGDWPGAGRTEEAVFYAYAVPQPDGFPAAKVEPQQARYATTLAEFLLPYDAVRSAEDPDAVLLDFMESTYRAAAERAGWDVQGLRHPGVSART